jgi:hypothetical protein
MAKKLNSIIQDNIFIQSLEFGITKIDTGTSYVEFQEFLKKVQPTMQQDFKHYMHVWFYENFYVKAIYDQVKDLRFTSGTFSDNNLKNFDNQPAIITADAYQKYVDYQELKVAYHSSKDASRLATIAILITAIIGILQIVVAVYT